MIDYLERVMSSGDPYQNAIADFTQQTRKRIDGILDQHRTVCFRAGEEAAKRVSNGT
jgi:hypothetical protein